MQFYLICVEYPPPPSHLPYHHHDHHLQIKDTSQNQSMTFHMALFSLGQETVALGSTNR